MQGNDTSITQIMDRVATVGLSCAMACLLLSFYVGGELAAAISFGAFVFAFIGALSAFSFGHLLPRVN